MKRLVPVLFVCAVVLASCGRRKGGHKPPPPPPPPPPAETRMTPAEMQGRQRFAAKNVGIPSQASYAPARYAARVVTGGPRTLDGIPVTYWTSTVILDAFENGTPAEKDKARAYARTWLSCERDGPCPEEIRGTKGWRHGSMVFSLNHQIGRAFGVYAMVQILGPDEARRYGDPSKTSRAKQMLLDVLTGANWWGTDGSSVGRNTPAGDHPEGYRSRHYASRLWMFAMAAADLARDGDVATEAAKQLDAAMEHLRPGVRADGLWDEDILPHFRADTGTRCPCQESDPACPEACWRVVKSKGLTCHPGETQVLSYILFLAPAWRPEFSGRGAECRSFDMYEQWMDYPRMAGARWRPRK